MNHYKTSFLDRYGSVDHHIEKRIEESKEKRHVTPSIHILANPGLSHDMQNHVIQHFGPNAASLIVKKHPNPSTYAIDSAIGDDRHLFIHELLSQHSNGVTANHIHRAIDKQAPDIGSVERYLEKGMLNQDHMDSIVKKHGSQALLYNVAVYARKTNNKDLLTHSIIKHGKDPYSIEMTLRGLHQNEEIPEGTIEKMIDSGNHDAMHQES